MEKKILVPIVLIVLIFLVIGVIKMAQKKIQTGQARHDVEEEITELQTKYDNLQGRVESLSTQRGMEDALREQYHVTVTGEEQIVIIENEEEILDTTEKSWFFRLFHRDE
jgi:peptidoglycan hydrolase CwlO-like protein